jgi:hypothetical protein
VTVNYEPCQWIHLQRGVVEVFARREAHPCN